MPQTHRPHLLIADRRPIAASGLAAALEQTVDLVVQGCCHDVQELSTMLGASSTIDAVVIDTEMFGGDGADAVETIRRLAPDVAILLLTTGVDESLLKALAHEYVSCVSAYSAVSTIEAALRSLLSGETLLPPEVQRALTNMLRQPQPAPSALLTLREKQVIELAATGLTICQMAARLNISQSTAKTHLLRIYEKLDAPNRSAAVATAVARGMLRVGTAAA